MQKKRIAVIFGGKSSEHEVSRVSATNVIRSIPKDRYDVLTIGITKQGRWLLYSGDTSAIADGSWEKHPDNLTAFIAPAPSVSGMVVIHPDRTEIMKIDVIFPVLHGKNGEDGTIQGLFEMSGIPYVGCGVLASAACMNKAVTNIMLEKFGIDQAKFTWFYAHEYFEAPDRIIADTEKELGSYPVFVKPANAGSSVGVSKAHNREELIRAIEIACAEDGKVVVEESIVGHEVECAVLGNDEVIASCVGEIKPAEEFYSYNAKYSNEESKTEIPADLPKEISEKIRKQAIKAFKAIDGKGLARVDFFVERKSNEIYINEINTMPGFTNISMYPKLFEKSGISYKELLNRLVDLSFENE